MLRGSRWWRRIAPGDRSGFSAWVSPVVVLSRIQCLSPKALTSVVQPTKQEAANIAPVTVRDWRFIAARSPSPLFLPLFAPKPPLFVIAYPALSLAFSTRHPAAMPTAQHPLLLPAHGTSAPPEHPSWRRLLPRLPFAPPTLISDCMTTGSRPPTSSPPIGALVRPVAPEFAAALLRMGRIRQLTVGQSLFLRATRPAGCMPCCVAHSPCRHGRAV